MDMLRGKTHWVSTVITVLGPSRTTFGLLVLGASSTPSDTFIVTIHAIYALACLRKYKLLDAFMTSATREARCVIRVFACHNRFVLDLELAHVAHIGAL
jgi:hypothetical protein